MWSVTAVAVSTYHDDGPGLDVCPPVQEDLDDPEAAFLSSIVEGSTFILSERQFLTDILNTNSIHTTHTYTYKLSFQHALIYSTVYKNYKMYVCMYV